MPGPAAHNQEWVKQSETNYIFFICTSGRCCALWSTQRKVNSSFFYFDPQYFAGHVPPGRDFVQPTQLFFSHIVLNSLPASSGGKTEKKAIPDRFLPDTPSALSGLRLRSPRPLYLCGENLSFYLTFRLIFLSLGTFFRISRRS